jgi:hypothetical protein
VGTALTNYATPFHVAGKVVEARPICEEALTYERRHGEPRSIAVNYRAIIASSLVTRALLLLARSNVDGAAELVSESIAEAAAAADYETMPVVLSAAAPGRWEKALAEGSELEVHDVLTVAAGVVASTELVGQSRAA